ncbi:MAG: hypothetical protein ABI835_07485 [Chloroflexota bacterium]
MKRIVLLVILAIFLTTLAAHAQEIFREQDAIDLAEQSEIFVAGLEQNPGWSAAAYDTHNAYGIWRVQFWDANGEELAWADVSPERGLVYSWEAYFGATDAQENAAEPVLRDFIANEPQFIDLLEDPSQYDMYVDYDSYNRYWGVYIDVGADSIWTAIQFEGKTPASLDNPQVLGLYFSNVLSYDEWKESNEATAIATAFQNADVANALNGIDNWTTSVERRDDGLWTVYFIDGESVVAQVQVDIAADQVVDYNVGE